MANVFQSIRRRLRMWSSLKMLRAQPGLIHDPWCSYCGKHLVGDDFTVDHVVPRSTLLALGISSDDNTVPCCKECNSLKSSTPLLEFLVRRRSAAALHGRKALWKFQPVEIVGARAGGGGIVVDLRFSNGRIRTVLERDLWLIALPDEHLSVETLRARFVAEHRALARTGY